MMKKVISSLMALTLCISPVSGIHNVYAADSASSGVVAQKGTKVADEVYEAFESGAEKVGVMISFAYHNDDEAAQIIQDEADKYVDSLDKGMYTEEELHLMWCNYSNKLSYDHYGEYMCSILEESGLGDIFTLSAGNSLFCIVNEEQLGVLENNERVRKITPRREFEAIAELDPAIFDVEPSEEMITDPAAVKEMLSDFIEKAGLDAVFAEEGEYPEYTQPVLIEFPMGTIANTLIINYAYKANIASTTYDFIPMDNGVPITTSLNTETTATTTTTTITTTTTLPDESTTTTSITTWNGEDERWTHAEYNHSPMKIGETRPVYFYSTRPASFYSNSDYEYAGLKTITSKSDCITYSYDEGEEVLYITAVAPGKAELVIKQENTIEVDVVTLTVIDEQYESETGKTEIDSAARKKARLIDFNNNGHPDTEDAYTILNYYAGKELTEETSELVEEYGDVDGNGVIDSLDASLLLAFLKDTRHPGDVNEDGMITATDASFVLSYAADIAAGTSDQDKNTELAGTKCFTYGDMNGDGKITSADASLILVEYANISGDQE